MDDFQRIGVDFDGTLAKWYGKAFVDYVPDKIGDPIPEMIERVKGWLAQGHDVVIFTARVHSFYLLDAEIARNAIEQWCQEQFGQILEVTCEKDPRMTQIWDDRAVSVEKDTGRVMTIGFMDEDLDYEPDEKSVMVEDCARCGGKHQVVFQKLRRDCEGWTHWASCPETGEPILMKIEDDEVPDSLGSQL
jgi:hypothetical protein